MAVITATYQNQSKEAYALDSDIFKHRKCVSKYIEKLRTEDILSRHTSPAILVCYTKNLTLWLHCFDCREKSKFLKHDDRRLSL